MLNHRANERILIVDDEPANLKLLQKLLQKQGYSKLELIADSRQVIAAYQREQPDLILLDLNMPHFDGFEILAQLAELRDPMLPPIVILTAQTRSEYMLQALQAGASDFISKPFDQHELLARVRNLLGVRLASRLMHEQNHILEALVREQTREIEESRLQIVQRLGRAAEYRDNETGAHVLRMSHMAARLAQAAGWSEDRCRLILHAAPMHDVGKIGIPDHILLKPGAFTDEERAIMQTHVEIGADILAGSDTPLLKLAHEIALTHHEKWDGTGYPRGLKGEEIPESGRITALVDVFDALTSKRPYKPAWPIEKALDVLKKDAGTHFDPRLVDLFMQLLPDMLAILQQFKEPEETQ